MEDTLMGHLKTDRIKTSQRMYYEAQVKVIMHQAGGDLESIRNRLGLSQRKICQLLLVDPSAWTRWTKKTSATTGPDDFSSAPPHIYRALQWYLALQEKIPGLTPQYFIGHFSSTPATEKNLDIKNQETTSQLLKRISELENQVRANRVGFFMIVGAMGLLVLALLFYMRILRAA